MHDRPLRRFVPIRLLGAILGAAALVSACAGAAAPGSSAPATPTPASAAPSPRPGATLGPDEAVAGVLARDPRFAGIGPLDPNVIGQSAWYEVSPGTVGWRVVVTRGWGDCEAGCISHHTWTFDVDGSGSVTLVGETGDPLPAGTGGEPSGPPVAIPAVGGPWIVGVAHAGPVCPVERIPPDPACADRPVAGAAVIVRDSGGRQVSQATTGPNGTFLAAVPAGDTYTVEAQPVEGLMGTPAAVDVVVPDGAGAWAVADLAYDTGIR